MPHFPEPAALSAAGKGDALGRCRWSAATIVALVVAAHGDDVSGQPASRSTIAATISLALRHPRATTLQNLDQDA
jgi:hypothetical protein